jgi:outer membrane protein OmpA-like peptidoglycan-associated protein
MIRRHALLALVPLVLSMTGCATAPTTPFLIFFTDDSATVQPAGREVVRSAAASATRFSEAPVRVLGFAGLDGGRTFSRELATTRAQHVVDLLVEAGVARGRIRIGTRSLVAANLMEEEVRRVEIRIGE